jgi:hypothetical protein
MEFGNGHSPYDTLISSIVTGGKSNMKIKTVLVASICLSFPCGANAQWSGATVTTTPTSGQEYVVLGGTVQPNSLDCYAPTGFCANAQGINLDQFANANDVNSELGNLDNSVSQLDAGLGITNGNVSQLMTGLDATNTSVSQLGAALSATNTKLGALQSEVNESIAEENRSFNRVYDLVAVSAALKDAVPVDGDRFALRINMGGYQGHFAGAIGGSVNISDRVRLSVNYGHGKSEQMFSGGLNFSFQ